VERGEIRGTDPRLLRTKKNPSQQRDRKESLTYKESRTCEGTLWLAIRRTEERGRGFHVNLLRKFVPHGRGNLNVVLGELTERIE